MFFDRVVGAIIGGVIGGLFALGIFVVVIVKCCLRKTAQRPRRMVNPTAVPTVTQTQCKFIFTFLELQKERNMEEMHAFPRVFYSLIGYQKYQNYNLVCQTRISST